MLSNGGKPYKFTLGGSVGTSFSVISDGRGGNQIEAGVAPAKVVAFTQAAAFAPSNAANTVPMSGGVTSNLAMAAHATASAGAAHL